HVARPSQQHHEFGPQYQRFLPDAVEHHHREDHPDAQPAVERVSRAPQASRLDHASSPSDRPTSRSSTRSATALVSSSSSTGMGGAPPEAIASPNRLNSSKCPLSASVLCHSTEPSL